MYYLLFTHDYEWNQDKNTEKSSTKLFGGASPAETRQLG